MEEELIDKGEMGQTGIPTFLKVLCILTFVGAGLVILFDIIYILLYDTFNSVFTKGIFASSEFSEMRHFLNETKKWTLIDYAFSASGAVFGLIGALMMWKLKKIGFYLYLFGQALALTGAVAMYIGLSSIKPFTSGFSTVDPATSAIIGVVWTFILCAAFIIMYGVNVKHLKN